MPLYSKYVEDSIKKDTTYNYWTRTTLEYKPSCEKPIGDAYDVLLELEQETNYTHQMNTVVTFTAVGIGIIEIILLVIFFCSVENDNPCCKDKNRTCTRVTLATIMMIMSALVVTFAALNFNQLTGKYDVLLKW